MRFLLFALLLVPFQAYSLTILSLNVEWFWDGQEPHEGQIAVGPASNPPSRKQVELEAYAIAQEIKHKDADIVGLVEVEGQSVVDRIQPYLGNEWSVVFEQGRDTYTGQDVALLTRLNVLANTTTTFPNITGHFDGVDKKPSKVLGVGLQDNQGEKYLVIVSHLISKRSSNDKKRAAQANAIVQAVNQHSPSYDHVIVMGDLNDVLGSDTLDQLTSSGLNAISDPNDFSYEHNGNQELIDHILVSSGLTSGADFSAFSMGPISDHRGVMAVLP